jgi:hypothetical protein
LLAGISVTPSGIESRLLICSFDNHMVVELHENPSNEQVRCEADRAFVAY